MSLGCTVQEVWPHEFTHAGQIHEILLTLGAHIAPNLMGLSPHDVAIFLKYRDGASSGAGSVFTAPCVLAPGALETDHLEKLQARPDLQRSHTKNGSVSSVLIAI